MVLVTPAKSGGPERPPRPGGSGFPLSRQGCPGNGNGLLCLDRNQLKVVMRGLDPRIHAVVGVASACCEDVDGRIKSRSSPAMTALSCTRVIALSDACPWQISRTALRLRGNDQ